MNIFQSWQTKHLVEEVVWNVRSVRQKESNTSWFDIRSSIRADRYLDGIGTVCILYWKEGNNIL